MKRKMMVFMLTAVLAGSMLAGCGSGDKSAEPSGETTQEIAENSTKDQPGSKSGGYVYRVGFINIDDADMNCYPAMLNFVADVESEEFARAVGADSVEVLTADSELNVEKQMTNVENMLTRGIDMLFLIGVDTEANSTAVEACNNEGIPVYQLGTDASSGEYKFIGWDEETLGKMQGEWCVENLPENSNICYLEGTPGREAAVKRKAGFEDAIAKREDLNLLSSQTGEFSTETAMQVTEDWIQKFDNDIDCIVACDNLMTLGASQAINAAGLRDDIINIGIIGNRGDAQMIKDGDLTAGIYVYWPNIGTLAAEIARQTYLGEGEQVEERSSIEIFPMTMDNCEELLDQCEPEQDS